MSKKGPALRDPVERFWELAERKELDDCWLWTARCDYDGYGKFDVGGSLEKTTVRAHRFAWILKHGPIPDGMQVLHHCDNPPCVNVAHLFLGTAADNSHDSVRKGRHYQGTKTHCKRGHPFTEENTYYSPGRYRRCRACRNLLY